MTERSGGKPAFPQTCADALDVGMVHEGMTLRQYYAAKAMQAMISGPIFEQEPDMIAECAFRQADAMIKAEEK